MTKEHKESHKEKKDEVVEISRAEYEALVAKAHEFSALQERMLRSAADFENAKKRLQKEKEEFSQYVLEDFMHDILPTLDNFERAFSHKSQTETELEKSIWSGIELVYKQLVENLKARGLKRMLTQGKPFDPHFHEAVAKVQAESDKEGLVAEEMLAGYMLNEKVLRPAKVKVYSASKEEKIEEIT